MAFDNEDELSHIDLPQDFEDEMKRLMTFLMDKVFEQVNKSVEEMIEKYPHLNNSVARFNMGQTLMLAIMAEFKHEIDQSLIMFISQATQGFVETAAASQTKKDKASPPEYIQ